MVPLRRMAVAFLVLPVALALAGCGNSTASPDDPASSPSPGTDSAGADLSVIACARDAPADVGELTGAWSGDDHGVYYVRQVGDCVWWFGTELVDIEPGLTGQPGFANVASGRVDGSRIVVEWADLPVGDILGGGGLTLVYDSDADQLLITERRGDWIPFGARVFTRIEPTAGPEASPNESASP